MTKGVGSAATALKAGAAALTVGAVTCLVHFDDMIVVDDREDEEDDLQEVSVEQEETGYWGWTNRQSAAETAFAECDSEENPSGLLAEENLETEQEEDKRTWSEQSNYSSIHDSNLSILYCNFSKEKPIF